MHIDRIPVYRAYQRTVDLDLYHAFAELVVQTSQDDTAGRTYRQMRTMQIWQPESDVFGYFEPYNLRYPGEVLERFEEKLGDDVRVLRALALALGNTCAIQSDNMFVGNQRGTFLQKVRRSAREDVYLQGALYLLETDTTQRHSLLDELAAKVYVRTEEALFVLSLFDDVEYGYVATAQQCIGNQVLLLKSIQHGQRLPMKAGAEPARQFLDGANPFAGRDCITDPVNTAV